MVLRRQRPYDCQYYSLAHYAKVSTQARLNKGNVPPLKLRLVKNLGKSPENAQRQFQNRGEIRPRTADGKTEFVDGDIDQFAGVLGIAGFLEDEEAAGCHFLIPFFVLVLGVVVCVVVCVVMVYGGGGTGQVDSCVYTRSMID